MYDVVLSRDAARTLERLTPWQKKNTQQSEAEVETMKRSFTIVVERAPKSSWLMGGLPGCYGQAPDLPTLETNMQEAIRVYLKTAEPEESLPDFVGTWRVEVTA